MNYYGTKELASAFRTVRQNTIQIAEDIPEDQYGFQAAPGVRTVAQILVHIGLMPRLSMQLGKTQSLPRDFDFGKMFAEVAAEEAKARTKAQIIEFLRTSGEEYASWIESLTEDFLSQVFTFPPGAEPPTRVRFEMILSAKEHEMHHRAQLMIIERMLGITPHLTRRNQERMAAMQRSAQPAKA